MDFVVIVFCTLAGFGIGYAYRGSIRRELSKLDVYAKDAHARLTAAVVKDEAALRAEVNKILDELKKFI